jgi:hypothetical protein
MGSQRFRLNKEDFVSIAKGFGVGLAGAILTYATEYFGKVDFGQYTPVAVAIMAVIANIIRKWTANNEEPETKPQV